VPIPRNISILRPLVDAGVIFAAKKKFTIPSRILGKYAAGKHGRAGSGLQKLFADREPFEAKIRSILEYRHLQIKGVVTSRSGITLRRSSTTGQTPHCYRYAAGDYQSCV